MLLVVYNMMTDAMNYKMVVVGAVGFDVI